MLGLNLILGVLPFAAAIPQQFARTHVNGALGPRDTSYFPQYLSDNSKDNGYPAGWNEPAGPPPKTGKTRYYDLTITRTSGSPDGVSKSLILINNQFPGPTIEANWGDTIQVKVTNKISQPEEGTTLHWHGFFQEGTPWQDGVPGVSQCPIAPGDSFTYRFDATQYGTTWYHSHVTAQYMDGAFGAIVVYGPSSAKYDVDVGPILLNDWSHTSYFKNLQAVYHKPSFGWPADNNLINGKMPFDCSIKTNDTDAPCKSVAGEFSKFNFQPGKTHRLRLINSGRQGNQKFSIDGHDLQVIANDFVPIKPYTTKVVTLGVGQRSDVLVRGKDDPRGAFLMRADVDPSCLNITAYQPNATAAVYYPQANKHELPKGHNKAQWDSFGCKNDPLSKAVPLVAQPVATPDYSESFGMTLEMNGTGFLRFYMNKSTAEINFNSPVLPQVASGNFNIPKSRNLINLKKGKAARIMFRNYNPYVHPMHLHGHNFQVLAEGFGQWDGKITNPQNPARRDTQVMPPGTDSAPSYMVMQWDSINPGLWPLHCHLLLHSNTGLGLMILEQPDQIAKLKAPSRVDDVCKNWDHFTKTHNVNQISSGFKLLAARVYDFFASRI